MATDLFGKYFNNPTKSYIYTNLICNTPSADEMSFDIIDSTGQITNNDEKLAGVDLSDVHVGLNQYTSDMRIIEPHSYLYIKGMIFGETYSSKTFGRIYGDIIEGEDDWMYHSVLFFAIKYLDTTSGKRKVEFLKIKSLPEEEKTFIDVCNDYFKDKSIPIEVSYDDGFVTFTSTELEYDFWIDHLLFWKAEDDYDLLAAINDWLVEQGLQYDYKIGWDDDYLKGNKIPADDYRLEKNVYSCIIAHEDFDRLYKLMDLLDTEFQEMLEAHDVKKIFLFEDFTKYISPRKYRNGAMKGALVKVTYPQFNADDIYDYQKSLKLAHLRDRVEEYHMIPDSVAHGVYMATRKILDVVDTFHCEYDSEAYDKLLGKYSTSKTKDEWIRHDELPQVIPTMLHMWERSHVPYGIQAKSIYKEIESRDAIGLAGYCVYATEHNLWTNIGQMYCITGVADDPSEPECKNLIPSFVLYNPNDFPVTVNYITFG